MAEHDSNSQRAREIVGWYTLAAGVTGAVPVPASSAAIVANNAFMLGHLASVMGSMVTWQEVVGSLGIAGTLNIAGRSVFIEAAKTLSWGTGQPWAAVALSAVGATTASLQTYIVGLIAIEICKNGGKVLSTSNANKVIEAAKQTHGAFVSEMKEKKIADPGKPPSTVE